MSDIESAPGNGWATESPRRNSAFTSKHRLLHVSELPKWYEPLSKFVRTGYRPPGLSACACAATLCQIHNETGNIWTHLLGGVAWVVVSFNSLRSADLSVHSDAFTYHLHAFGYALCFLMPLLSSLAHTFHCMGEKWYLTCWHADHVGILTLWLARALCEGYVLLACLPFEVWTCWAVACVGVFSAAAWAMLTARAGTGLFLPLFAFIHLPLLLAAAFEDAFWLREPGEGDGEASGGSGVGGPTAVLKMANLVAVFPSSSIGSSSSGVGGSLTEGWGWGPVGAVAGGAEVRELGDLLREGVALTLYGSACGVVGYAVMVAKVPERWFAPTSLSSTTTGGAHPGSGLFDLWLHSHQWWHVLTIVGPVLCLEAGRTLLHARVLHACPS
mmetsp:Transcript_51680/g.103748  ORF Transcript_51680/g.103748 Transcript_51680/m.103748 type:complete len:386 (+) Transcript_51680:122-1279(+)